MESAFFEYYSQLLYFEMFDVNYEALYKCLQLIPKKVPGEDSIRLNNPITLDEIKWATNSLANNKSPGIDGIPVEFYKTNIDWVSSELLALMRTHSVENL